MQDEMARVIHLHGIESHSGWFEDTISRLKEARFEVRALERNREVDSFKAHIEDVRGACGTWASHILAVSWGGKLACAFAIVHPELVRSLVLVAPGLAPKADFNLWGKSGICLSMLLRPSKMFDVPIPREEMFTKNSEKVEFIKNDPLRTRRAHARFFYETRRMDRFIRRNLNRVRAPIFLLLAERDEIVDNYRTLDLFKRFASVQKEFKVYVGASHTLEFENGPLREEIVADIIGWMRSH